MPGLYQFCPSSGGLVCIQPKYAPESPVGSVTLRADYSPKQRGLSLTPCPGQWPGGALGGILSLFLIAQNGKVILGQRLSCYTSVCDRRHMRCTIAPAPGGGYGLAKRSGGAP